MKLVPFLFIILLSCNTGQKDPEQPVQDKLDTTEVNVDLSSMLGTTECYWRIAGRDTLVAILLQTGNEITGKLSFDNYRIDGSAGIVTGTIESDIIRLWYNYQSEGTRNIMEIWFRKHEDLLIRGIGPTDVKGDTSYYTDQQAIRFTNEQVLRKTSCDSIPEKYR